MFCQLNDILNFLHKKDERWHLVEVVSCLISLASAPPRSLFFLLISNIRNSPISVIMSDGGCGVLRVNLYACYSHLIVRVFDRINFSKEISCPFRKIVSINYRLGFFVSSIKMSSIHFQKIQWRLLIRSLIHCLSWMIGLTLLCQLK